MMSTNGIARLQQARFEGFMDTHDKMDSAQNRAMENHEEAVDESYAQAMREIDASERAHNKKSDGAMTGAIIGARYLGILGFLLGSAIGRAIGGAMARGDEKEAHAAKRLTGIADEQVEESWDQVKDSQEDMDNVMQQAERIRQTSEMLDQQGWTRVKD